MRSIPVQEFEFLLLIFELCMHYEFVHLLGYRKRINNLIKECEKRTIGRLYAMRDVHKLCLNEQTALILRLNECDLFSRW